VFLAAELHVTGTLRAVVAPVAMTAAPVVVR
jgi:hypothetical protein